MCQLGHPKHKAVYAVSLLRRCKSVRHSMPGVPPEARPCRELRREIRGRSAGCRRIFACLSWSAAGSLSALLLLSLWYGCGVFQHVVLTCGTVAVYSDSVTKSAVEFWRLDRILTLEERCKACFGLPTVASWQAGTVVGGAGWAVLCPLWIPVSASVITGLVTSQRGARTPTHGCVSCGYDLTGNVTGRCPECGRVH